MATLKEIAAAAGYSVRTVNRVLKEEGYASGEARQKITEVVKRLGYRPDRVARSLKSRRSFEITVVASSFDELHVRKMAGIEQVLRLREYTMGVYFPRVSESSNEAEAGSIAGEIASRNPTGAVIFPLPGQNPGEIATAVAAAGIPYIVVDVDDPKIDAVRIDRSAGIHDAVHYLFDRGRRRIAYLGTPKDENRLLGYRRAVAALGTGEILLDVSVHTHGVDLFERGRLAAHELSQNHVDAVQAYSDLTAFGFLRGLHEAGIAVPGMVAVVGFDDRTAARIIWPALTTVSQPSERVGETAAELLLEKIKVGTVDGHGKYSRVLPTKLVVRESA